MSKQKSSWAKITQPRALFLCYFAFLLTGCQFMKTRIYEVITTPDNFVEEFVEERIEDVTGFDIDLSADDE